MTKHIFTFNNNGQRTLLAGTCYEEEFENIKRFFKGILPIGVKATHLEDRETIDNSIKVRHLATLPTAKLESRLIGRLIVADLTFSNFFKKEYGYDEQDDSLVCMQTDDLERLWQDVDDSYIYYGEGGPYLLLRQNHERFLMRQMCYMKDVKLGERFKVYLRSGLFVKVPLFTAVDGMEYNAVDDQGYMLYFPDNKICHTKWG